MDQTEPEQRLKVVTVSGGLAYALSSTKEAKADLKQRKDGALG